MTPTQSNNKSLYDKLFFRINEIMGTSQSLRAIDLADVLRSIGMFLQRDVVSWCVRFNGSHAYFTLYCGSENIEMKAEWDLNKNTSGQSQETQEWLLNLLSGN